MINMMINLSSNIYINTRPVIDISFVVASSSCSSLLSDSIKADLQVAVF